MFYIYTIVKAISDDSVGIGNTSEWSIKECYRLTASVQTNSFVVFVFSRC